MGRRCLALAVVGDCGGIVFRPNGQVAFQTPKHTLHDNDNEHDRVMRAGGFIDGGRVNGSLIPTRAFGDFNFKAGESGAPLVTSRPDVTVLNREQCAAVVLYSDGVSDALSPMDVWVAMANAAREGGFVSSSSLSSSSSSSSSNGGKGGSGHQQQEQQQHGDSSTTSHQEQKQDTTTSSSASAAPLSPRQREGGEDAAKGKSCGGPGSFMKGLVAGATSSVAAATKVSLEARLSRAVVNEAIRMGSTDNISCVVLFPNGADVMRFDDDVGSVSGGMGYSALVVESVHVSSTDAESGALLLSPTHAPCEETEEVTGDAARRGLMSEGQL